MGWGLDTSVSFKCQKCCTCVMRGVRGWGEICKGVKCGTFASVNVVKHMRTKQYPVRPGIMKWGPAQLLLVLALELSVHCALLWFPGSNTPDSAPAELDDYLMGCIRAGKTQKCAMYTPLAYSEVPPVKSLWELSYCPLLELSRKQSISCSFCWLLKFNF